VFTLPWNRVF